MAVLTPGRSSGLDDLLRRIRDQIFTWCCEPETWFVCYVSNELFQENWSFKPPMAEQFRIERSDNDGIETNFADFAGLLIALFQKLNCMLCCLIFGCRSVIELFLIAGVGDSVVLDAGELSGSTRDRSQMFHWQIETDVAIKFPVYRIAWITFLCAPDLATGFGIAGESRRPRWCIAGSVNGATRARCSEQ